MLAHVPYDPCDNLFVHFCELFSECSLTNHLSESASAMNVMENKEDKVIALMERVF